MSSLSLNHLLTSGHSSNTVINKKFGNSKYATLPPKFGQKDINNNNNNNDKKFVPPPPSSSRRRSNFRNSCIYKNPFRGVSKQFIERQATIIIHNMTIDELYQEVLYELLHNVGCDENEIQQEAVFSYLQDAFKVSPEKHEELLDIARTKEAPELRLNLEVIEAKDLNSKDPNGLADPFVTLYIASAPEKRYNSSVKAETLNPRWEEHFSLPIADNPNEESLIVEVWDFDPAETFSEKMKKIPDVKGLKGMSKLMKEIASTVSSGRHENELVGRANIPLKSIPTSGLTMWCSLEKKNKVKPQGEIKVRMNFSSEKNDQVAIQEHRHLLRLLLTHELESSKVAQYWWAGKFSHSGERVLLQHAAQSGLTEIDVAFAQWSVFTEVHQQHCLAFSLFDSILDKLIRSVQTKSFYHEEEHNIFWEATKRILPSCFSKIRKLRKDVAGEKNVLKTLTEVLNIISKVAMLEPPEGTILFPVQLYGWLKQPNSWDIREALNDAIETGAKEWFHSTLDTNELNSGEDEAKLQCIIKMTQLVRSDVQRAIEFYDKVFHETMNCPYSKLLYKLYEKEISVIAKPVVEDACKNMKRIILPEDRYTRLQEAGNINMGTTLFELYLILKRFQILSIALCPGETEFEINNYFQWFEVGVSHWLDISVYKALSRIQKAIDLDVLVPVDEAVKYSSSAVDTLAIFYQIKIFWKQLDWPQAEGSYIFVSKIVDDICRSCVFYADRMAQKVENLGKVENIYEKKFEVTQEWCLAINNIDYIKQSIHPFVKELDVDQIILNMSECLGEMEAQRCSETLKNVIENAIDTVGNKIVELIENVSEKMAPPMRRFLTEGAELLNTDSNSMDRLMMYLETSLSTLHLELNEDNFDKILDAIWQQLSTILFHLVNSSLEKRRPPSFFANLRGALNMLITNFKSHNSNTTSDKETLENVQRLLELHGYETSDLIQQYYLDRYKEQNEMTDTPLGILTVQCYFKGNSLEIEILNGKHLVPLDTNGLCDPFVRVHFLPEEKFLSVVKPKTQTQTKTLFPLFDEKFSIPLTSEQRALPNALIMFSVKDKDYFGMSNQYAGDSFLAFSDIADITEDSGQIKQMHLTLTKPKNFNLDSLNALEYRQGDKLAKDFLKKLKARITDSTPK